MLPKIPDLSPEQLKVYLALQRARMAWQAFYAIGVLFTITLGFFMYTLLWLDSQGNAKLIVGVIDTVLGAALLIIVRHLFPSTPSS